MPDTNNVTAPRLPRDMSAEESRALQPGDLHYRAYVGPPDRFDFMGATQFALLFALGLREDARLLDVGCGSLRAGRLLIPYLLPNRYFGIDPNAWLIDDAIERELGRDAVAIKQPRFAYHRDFACDVFGTQFDFIVAQSMLTHCGIDLATRLLSEMAKSLAPGGKIVFSILRQDDSAERTERCGWVYPDCVLYSDAHIADLCAAQGLHCRRLAWFHPGASWYLARHAGDPLPSEAELALLTGAVLFDPQFAASRPVT